MEILFKYLHFNLEDYSIISIVWGSAIEISPSILGDFYDLPPIKSSLYPYNGKGAPAKTAMRNLYVS